MSLAPSSLLDILVGGRRDKGLKRLVREEELERLFVESATNPREAEIGQFNSATQEKLLQGDFRGAAVAEADAEDKAHDLAFENLKFSPPQGATPSDIFRDTRVRESESVLRERNILAPAGNFPLPISEKGFDPVPTPHQRAEALFPQPALTAPPRTLSEAQHPIAAPLGELARIFVEPIDPETGAPDPSLLTGVIGKTPRALKAVGKLGKAAREAAKAVKGARACHEESSGDLLRNGHSREKTIQRATYLFFRKHKSALSAFCLRLTQFLVSFVRVLLWLVVLLFSPSRRKTAQSKIDIHMDCLR